MRAIPLRVPAGRRPAVSFRNALTLCLGAALLATGCATSGRGDAWAGADLDSPQRECERNNGVWRPQIADGFCEQSR